MAKFYISNSDKNTLETRANHRCEYCQSPKKYSPQPFNCEHIIPLSSGGHSDLDNLALSCGGCNGHKYTKTTGIDPITGLEVSLFHPRKDKWSEHFEWSADFLQMIGVTAIGRTSIQTLQLNREEVVNLRSLIILTGEHPP